MALLRRMLPLAFGPRLLPPAALAGPALAVPSRPIFAGAMQVFRAAPFFSPAGATAFSPAPAAPQQGMFLGVGRGALRPGTVSSAPSRLLISGITRDSAGAILGSCAVALYRTRDDAEIERVTSDATTGAFSFGGVGLSQTYYVVAYKAGSPDVAGTTVNTLIGT